MGSAFPELPVLPGLPELPIYRDAHAAVKYAQVLRNSGSEQKPRNDVLIKQMEAAQREHERTQKIQQRYAKLAQPLNSPAKTTSYSVGGPVQTAEMQNMLGIFQQTAKGQNMEQVDNALQSVIAKNWCFRDLMNRYHLSHADEAELLQIMELEVQRNKEERGNTPETEQLETIKMLLGDLRIPFGSEGYDIMAKDYLRLKGLEHMIPVIFPKKEEVTPTWMKAGAAACAAVISAIGSTVALAPTICFPDALEDCSQCCFANRQGQEDFLTATGYGAMGVSLFSLAAMTFVLKRLQNTPYRKKKKADKLKKKEEKAKQKQLKKYVKNLQKTNTKGTLQLPQ